MRLSKSKLDGTSSTKRGAAATSMSRTNTLLASKQGLCDFRSESTLRIVKLLTRKQKLLLEIKERLQSLTSEKELKELELWRSTGKFEDRQALLEDAEAELQKIKSYLFEATIQASKFGESWTNFENDGSAHFPSTNVSEEDLQNQISDLEKQLQCEERNIKQSQLKMLGSKLDCERCEQSLLDCQDSYVQAMEAQITTEWHLTSVAEYMSRMKGGDLGSLHPMPIDRPLGSSRSRIITVTECLLCHEHFDSNDICVASCGHCYHLWCLYLHFSRFTKCKSDGSDGESDFLWRWSFGFVNGPHRLETSKDNLL